MIVQLSSGQGPQECRLAVGLLLKTLQREFPDIEVISKKKAFQRYGEEKDCYTSVMFQTEQDLSELEGSMLWICYSPYRPNHGRKNWFVDVSIIPEIEKVSREEEYQIETLHSGGHGGQNVNKVESGVRVRHIPTGITVVCTEERSQHMNKKKAMERIEKQLAELEENGMAKQQNDAWREHNRIVRGNPVRVYEGRRFERRR